jgi:restriction endonuclease S subunit
MYCICCKKNNVIPNTPPISSKIATEDSPPQHEEDILWKDSKRPDGSLVNVNNEMIDNGIIHIIDAGYGSTHDGDQFIIAICDDCIKENLQDATLLYWGNYMYGNEGFVRDEIENSKQKYRRRNSLDKLI